MVFQGIARQRPMISELDVHRTAKLLVDQHGDTAILNASERAEQLWRQGDADGAATWERVARAVAALMQTEAEGPIN